MCHVFVKSNQRWWEFHAMESKWRLCLTFRVSKDHDWKMYKIIYNQYNFKRNIEKLKKSKTCNATLFGLYSWFLNVMIEEKVFFPASATWWPRCLIFRHDTQMSDYYLQKMNEYKVISLPEMKGSYLVGPLGSLKHEKCKRGQKAKWSKNELKSIEAIKCDDTNLDLGHLLNHVK